MQESKARSLLGMSLMASLSKESIRRAHHATVRAVHPDKGGAGGNVAEINEARKTLLSLVVAPTIEYTCRNCNGSGTVSNGSFGSRCTFCKGTGKTNRG